MPSFKKQFGFTLIELMVSIAIVAIVSAVFVVVLSTDLKSGRVSKRAQDLRAIQSALEVYKSATGSYPAVANFTCVGAALSATLVPAYMPVVPADPLDNGNAATGTNCYQYKGTANEYKVRTNSTIAAAASGPEMSTTQFQSQPNLIDPMLDGAADCTVVATGNASGFPTGWAVYSSVGTAAATNSCGY